jgi:beta-1,2-mannobiose phosphorylase / 1,2-beta-oligomannan phosphorylase
MFNLKRSDANPILSPNKNHQWEAYSTFNPTAVRTGRDVHLFYRALSSPDILEEPHISRSIIGRAISKNGDIFTDRKPFISPELDFERYGCEDPRVTKFGGKYYFFYTALSGYPYNADNIKTAVAISEDLENIKEKHLVTTFNAKAMTLFPEKINGKYAAILLVNPDRPPSKIGYAEFETEEEMWSEEYWKKWYEDLDSHTLNISKNDSEQVEPGCQPIKTKYGWLLIYSHIERYFTDQKIFGIRAVLLDLKNPKIIIGEHKQSFMVPEMYYEKVGMVGNVVFPSGALVNKDILEIYYGSTDTFCNVATVNLEVFLETLIKPNKGLIKRSITNPILETRTKMDWEAHGVFNPAAIELDGKIHILYRAMSMDDTSTIGYAATLDGENIIERSSKPIYIPREEFEKKIGDGYSGCEDPRLIEIDGTVYMFYTAFDGHTPKVAVASIPEKDFLDKNWRKWTKASIITPSDVANKDGCIIPEKTEKGYVVIHRVNESICADIFETLDFSKERVKKCIEIIGPRQGMWDGLKVGLSAPPIKTKNGWLMLYHGVSENKIYRIGAILLDLKDPTTVLGRTAMPIFEPEEPYELDGTVPNVVFPCGNVRRKDKLFIYYGGADKVVGLATVKVSDLLKKVL